MSTRELIRGFVVMIDDNLEDGEDAMNTIADNLKEDGYPIVKYLDLPEEKVYKNFVNPSFIVLDWELEDFSKLGDAAKEGRIEENIEFIKKIKEVLFCPIFIFSNRTPESITSKLEESGLYDQDRPNYIFVKRKIDVNSADSFFAEVEKWYEETPSVYVMAEWDTKLIEARNKLLWSFYKIDHTWPCVLNQAYSKDGVDPTFELGYFLTRNLLVRQKELNVPEDVLNEDKISPDITSSQIRSVLEGDRFLPQSHLSSKPSLGDFFAIFNTQTNQNSYYLNIRPDCDILRCSNPEMYLIKGRLVDEERINNEDPREEIVFQNGAFLDRANLTYMIPLNGGQMFEFLFNDLKIKKWNSIKEHRVGRILAPYITKIQQKYTFYLQRQGVPGDPSQIF